MDQTDSYIQTLEYRSERNQKALICKSQAIFARTTNYSLSQVRVQAFSASGRTEMRHSAGDGSGGNWMEAAGIERMNVRQLLLKETPKWSYGSHLWPRKTQTGPEHTPPPPTHREQCG